MMHKVPNRRKYSWEFLFMPILETWPLSLKAKALAATLVLHTKYQMLGVKPWRCL